MKKTVERLKKRMGILFVMSIALALILMPSPAMAESGIDAPEGASQIAVPVSVPVSGDVAGCEIEFTVTSGLIYKGFSVAPSYRDIGMKVDTAVNGKNYFGFFASENLYAAASGVLAVGNLVFEYTGNDPQAITFSDVRVHTVKNDGSILTDKTNPNTTVRITRGGTGGNSGDSDGGNSGGNPDGGNPDGELGGNSPGGNSNGGGSNSGNSGNSSGASLVSLQTTGTVTQNTIDVDADYLLADEETVRAAVIAPDFTADAQSTEISEQDTPLARADTGSNTLLYILIPLLVICVLLVFFLLARHRKKARGDSM